MWGISYWIVPIFSACVWLAMLIAMLVVWAREGFPHYVSMDERQTIAYISDIGASGLKPLFIAMSTVTVVTFTLSFVFERWLRHTRRLAPNTSIWQKIYSGIAIGMAIAGAAGLILLSIFDTRRHPKLHNGFLVLFIGGYIVSAIFICWEYQRLGIHFREHSVLRISFWIKLVFILLEVALAIAFGVTQKQKKWNAAAVLEWVIAFIYFFYVLSFFIDFMPAVRTKHHQSRETEMDMAGVEAGTQHGDGAAMDQSYFRGGSTAQLNNGYATNGYANGNTNAVPNPYTSHNTDEYYNGPGAPANGHVKPTEPVAASRNF
ncbi:hypothetical protein P154DRAFT_520010 [Amniculicola lignicola CBS 123094]|uniref:CWH43-like N-terminal domain-containing protein n=1 Tax=Amniculicola lignicola CBS 123094 TaxID=1392246 RepID=A0A6A5WNG1_9PLEO|nr:hypothetical protein P154DRAFT_520010 [Amniculicola lignicola CBS 123094]